MHIIPHATGNQSIAEITADELLFTSQESGLDLLGNIYYQGFDGIILHAKDIHPSFFDLKTKLAGDILQKFSNYQMRLALVGDFERVESLSLRDFIRESNRGKAVCFVNSVKAALEKLSD